MNLTQLEFKASGTGTSQCDKILAELERRAGAWVPMTTLWKASGAFAVHSRICDLRKRGHVIKHRNEHKDGVVHSFYKLNLGADEAAA